MAQTTIDVIKPVSVKHSHRDGYVSLAVAIGAAAVSSNLIRLAQQGGVPSLMVAALRLLLAVIILTPFVLRRYGDQLRTVTRREMTLMAVAGFWLAVHFATFITALEYTSVLIASVLVMTNPLWVALLEALFFKAKPSSMVWTGLLYVMAGGGMIAFGGKTSIGLGTNPVLGALLAVAGAIAGSIYMLVGREVRARISLMPYVWIVYGWGAGFSLLLVLLTGTPIKGSAEGYFWVVMIAVIAQLMGHSAINSALRYFAATYVSILSQIAVVLSAIVAFFLFGEIPRPLQLLGSATILAGVILANLGQRKSQLNHDTGEDEEIQL